ncbi:GNAT family N-acetyltransferase [Neobacillus kokaensis]|uniref:N-acetyltransferase domain-containing protein n=1 Tax=Neobacillus kokaensis TaxID=2759023 RepID=A0ABQ3N2Y3_9BACI|nr:hypothetical protein [Neobacillus kokaensis]GHH97932.1 hypothetical protein AM1BK_14750 [Neobacillus kokaensis]
MQALIRKADIEDLELLKAFLTRANLGTDGLTAETIESFLLLQDENDEIKGTLGMEVFQGAGLLRSLVVSPGQAEKEIFVLFDQMVKFAKEKGMESLFLATNKAVTVPFFELMGFKQVERDELPNKFYGSEHIRHILNVDNSLFLKLSL